MNSPESIAEDKDCKRCHTLMSVPFGMDPTEYCDTCAQELVVELTAALKARETEYQKSIDIQLLEINGLEADKTALRTRAEKAEAQFTEAVEDYQITINELCTRSEKAEVEIARIRKELSGPASATGQNVFEREQSLKSDLADAVGALRPFEEYATTVDGLAKEGGFGPYDNNAAVYGQYGGKMVTIGNCRHAAAIVGKHEKKP